MVSEAHVSVHNPDWQWLRMLHTGNGTHFERLHPVTEGSETYEVGQSWVEEVREQIVHYSVRPMPEHAGADDDVELQEHSDKKEASGLTENAAKVLVMMKESG